MKPLPFCLLVLASILGSMRAAAPVDLTEWADAAQDSTGMIWGVPLRNGLQIYTHDGASWKPLVWSPAPGFNRARPLAVASGRDGAVRVLWRSLDNDTCWLSQHKWPTSSMIAQFNAKFEGAEFRDASIFVDSAENVWITHKGPSILRKAKSGGVTEAYVIPKEHLLNQKDRLGQDSHFFGPAMFEDDRGHVWFWMNGESSNVVRLDSFIEFDGSRFVHHKFSGLPANGECAALGPDDAGHLMAGFKRSGLFRLDLSNDTAKPVEGPERSSFVEPSFILRSNGTTYVVARNISSMREWAALWQCPPGATPRKIVSEVAAFPGTTTGWLQLPNGLVLAGNGGALIYVPGEGEPQRLDWSSNVAVGLVKRLFRTGTGNLLLLGSQNGSSIAQLPPWPLARRSVGCEELKNRNVFMRDSRGHVWAINLDTHEPEDWNGTQWTPHPFSRPDKNINALSVDTHDRIWAFAPGHVAHVLDQGSGKWQDWPDFHAAVEQYLREDPKFIFQPYIDVRMTASGDGRAVIRHGTVGSAEYFDGSSWQFWRHPDVPRGLAQFDGSGQLFVVATDSAFRFDHGKWEPASVESTGLARPRINEDGADTRVGRTAGGQNIVADQNGDLWFTAGRRLYRSRGGVDVAIFKEGEPNPFLDGRGLMDVVVDGVGNVFLQTSISTGIWVMLHREAIPR